MSISADQIQLLLDGGRDGEDILLLAKAMQRGDDYRSITCVIEALRTEGSDPDVICNVVLDLAQDIIAREAPRVRIWDEHTDKKDSNRSRRGMPDNLWRALRLEIFERDEHACQYCGDGNDLTCDHIVPLVRGGTNDPENLVTACRSCNSSKGDKLLTEWPGRDTFQ